MNQYFNVVSNEILKLAINDYNFKLVYETTSMNKATPENSLELFTPIIEKLLNQKIKYKSGNFYKHKYSYLPHTDYKIDQNNTLNVVIPLWYVGELANLIIFDQRWHKNSVTWCLNGPEIEFKVNTGVPGNPCDYEDVLLKTNEPIDREFYEKYLSHYSKECYWGLSGKAFTLEPGSIIIFDNRHIHCTSKFKGEKLGISLRYSI
jgi:hypothetical protein